jgi:hypothetical protein
LLKRRDYSFLRSSLVCHARHGTPRRSQSKGDDFDRLGSFFKTAHYPETRRHETQHARVICFPVSYKQEEHAILAP